MSADQSREDYYREILKGHPKYANNPDLLEREIQNRIAQNVVVVGECTSCEPSPKNPPKLKYDRHPDFPLDDDAIKNYDRDECLRRLAILKRFPENHTDIGLDELHDTILRLINDPTILKEYEVAEKRKIRFERIKQRKSKNSTKRDVDKIKLGEKILKDFDLLTKVKIDV